MKWILDRLKEPSTYKGLAALLALSGLYLSEEAQVAIATAAPQVASAVLACIGVYNVMRKETR